MGHTSRKLTACCIKQFVLLFLVLAPCLGTKHRKFIVLTIGHSGSKNLAKVLDKHPNVLMKGELLFDRKYKFDLDQAVKRVDEIFTKMLPQMTSENTTAIGFKLLYHHIWPHPTEFFTELRKRHPDLAFIHLIRTNYFEHYLSFYSYLKSNDNPDNLHVLNHVSDTALRVSVMNLLIATHPGPSMTTLYEDCVQSFDSQLQRISLFLGVPFHSLDFGSTRKSTHQAPWTRLKNWPKICAAIRNRQRLDQNFHSDCLARWSFSEWETDVSHHCLENASI